MLQRIKERRDHFGHRLSSMNVLIIQDDVAAAANLQALQLLFEAPAALFGCHFRMCSPQKGSTEGQLESPTRWKA